MSGQSSRIVEPLERRILMAVLSVTNNNDSGGGSLRSQIAAASAGDVIDLRNRSGTITLTGGEIAIGNDLTIEGPGANVLTLDGNSASRVFNVGNASVTISNVTLADGKSTGFGGAIYSAGSLTLDRVTVRNSQGTVFGGGIYETGGTLTIIDSTIASNTAVGNDSNANPTAGGGVYAGGTMLTVSGSTFNDNAALAGIDTYPVSGWAGIGGGICIGARAASFANSTITGNTAIGDSSSVGPALSGYGGGIASQTSGAVSLTNCTIANNVVSGGTGTTGYSPYSQGGGAYFESTPTLYNNLIAGNVGADNTQLWLLTGANGGGNLVTSNGATAVNGLANGVNGNQFDVDLLALGTLSLADNGGPTLTIAPDAALTQNLGVTDTLGTPGLSFRPTTSAGLLRKNAPDIGAYEIVTNHAPNFTSDLSGAFVTEIGQHLSITITAADADGDALTITASNLPDWATLTDNGDGTATISGTPAESDVVWPTQYTDYPVTLSVSDGTTSTDASLDMQASKINVAPQITSDPIRRETTGVIYTYDVTATDGNDDPLTLSATTLPWWLTFVDHGDGTGTLSGTRPTSGSGGVTIRVDDGITFTTQTFTVTVAQDSAPTFTSSAPTAGVVGALYNYLVQTTDADGNPLILTAPTLPGWLTLTDHHDGTATLSGTPTQAGDSAVVLRVSDSAMTTDQSWNIAVPPTNSAPVFDHSTSPPATAEALESYSHTFTATDVDGDSLTFTLASGPAWMSLIDHGDGTATISGVPDITEMGVTTPCIVNVSDGSATAAANFDVNVPAWRFRLDAGGTLAVVGSNSADNITIMPAAKGVLRVNYNGTVKNFSAASVTSVQVYGQDGDDVLILSTGSIPTYVLGGAGNDTLIGGDQADNLVGGGGKDLIEGNAGDDRLSGLAGNDNILGGGGKDRLYGGNGSDYINGGTGADRIWGEAGSDTIIAKDKYPDQLYADSASATDSAQVDALDTLNGVFDSYT